MASLPIEVKEEMSKKHHRVAHFLWHSLRGLWERLDSESREYIMSIYPGWEVPRPSHDSNRQVIRDNDSGEDFLYMHRQMIALTNSILVEVGNSDYPSVQGWVDLPEPGDAEFPVVPMQGLEEIKSDSFFNSRMKPWEIRYKSKEYLSSVTLGELGSDLEFSIHNMMHMRWATPMPNDVGYRPNTGIDQAIESKWDDIRYDYLGDTYSSHVHETFWKIHGWVDERIEDWKESNNVDEIQWKGTWVGPMHHHDHDDMAEMVHPKILTDLRGMPEVELDSNFERMIKVSKVLARFDDVGFISKEIPEL